jgi:hypothetical protein
MNRTFHRAGSYPPLFKRLPWTQTLGPLTLKNVARPVEAFVLWPARHEIAKLAG